MSRGVVSPIFEVEIVQGSAKKTANMPVLVVDGIPQGTTTLRRGYTYVFLWKGNDDWTEEELGDLAFCHTPCYPGPSLDQFQIPGTSTISLGKVATICIEDNSFPVLYVCSTKHTGTWLAFRFLVPWEERQYDYKGRPMWDNNC